VNCSWRKGSKDVTGEETKLIERAKRVVEWASTVIKLQDQEPAGTFHEDLMRGVRAVNGAFSPEWIHTQERAPGPQDADGAEKIRAIVAWLDEEEDGLVNNSLVTVRWEVVKKHPDRYVRWHALLRIPEESVLPGLEEDV